MYSHGPGTLLQYLCDISCVGYTLPRSNCVSLFHPTRKIRKEERDRESLAIENQPIPHRYSQCDASVFRNRTGHSSSDDKNSNHFERIFRRGELAATFSVFPMVASLFPFGEESPSTLPNLLIVTETIRSRENFLVHLQFPADGRRSFLSFFLSFFPSYNAQIFSFLIRDHFFLQIRSTLLSSIKILRCVNVTFHLQFFSINLHHRCCAVSRLQLGERESQVFAEYFFQSFYRFFRLSSTI